MNAKIFNRAPARLLLLLIAIGLCAWAVNWTARLGLSRMFARYSMSTGNLMAADKAIEMSPNDADSHRVRAGALAISQSPAESAGEMERAVSLRAADYSLWSDLGLIRDQLGDTAGALAAFDEAVKRAPFYALPRWQRGNLLLRAGQYDAAFNDLNLAVQSNPELVRSFIDLAWNLSHGDPKAVQQMVRINNKSGHSALAKFFANHGKPQEALQEFQAAGTNDVDTRNDVIYYLLDKKSFAEAYQLWSAAKGVTVDNGGHQIFDGGFESPLKFDDFGFAWRIPRRLPATTVSLDSSEPHSGSKNLRIEFAGDSNPGTNLVSQLLVVEPGRRYKINFAVRSQEIVSGGLPIIAVTDAIVNKRLGQSPPLSKGTTGWTVVSFEFTTQPTTNAVVLSVQREECSAPPCPIFGVLSLDSFSIEQLK